MKVCLVGSSGGHLNHLYMLKPFWKDKDHFWVTFDKEDARSLLEGEPLMLSFLLFLFSSTSTQVPSTRCLLCAIS